MGAKGLPPPSPLLPLSPTYAQSDGEKGKRGNCSYHSERVKRIDRKGGEIERRGAAYFHGGVSDWLFLATLMALGEGEEEEEVYRRR